MSSSDVPAGIRDLAARFLADAAAVDAADTIPEAHLRGLADAGLYGIFAPAEAGGLGLDAEVGLVIEELASACLASTFVWLQHLRLLGAMLDPGTPAALREALLPAVVRGEVRGGVALAGLLPGPPRLTARPVDGGWLLDGDAPWVSGWGIVDLLVVAARGPEDTTVTLLVDAREQHGLAAARQRLGAVNASATVQLSFAGLFVPDGRFVGQKPYDPVSAQSEGLRGNGIPGPRRGPPLLRAHRAVPAGRRARRVPRRTRRGGHRRHAGRQGLGLGVRRTRRGTSSPSGAAAGPRWPAMTPSGWPGRRASCWSSAAGPRSRTRCLIGSPGAASGPRVTARTAPAVAIEMNA